MARRGARTSQARRSLRCWVPMPLDPRLAGLALRDDQRGIAVSPSEAGRVQAEAATSVPVKRLDVAEVAMARRAVAFGQAGPPAATVAVPRRGHGVLVTVAMPAGAVT